MTSPTPPSPRSRSQASGRRSRQHHHHHHHHHHRHQHLLHSDCPPDVDDDDIKTSPTLLNQQRSVSLTTLQPTAVIQPRMAQLETLEAKMASIEVSLSSTPRRKKNGSLSGMSLGSSSIIRSSVSKEINVKELECLRNALKDKENIIQNLKGQLTIPGLRLTPIKNCNGTNKCELSDVEKRQAEERLNRLRTDIDNKRLAIKNLKMALERLDITDNIDVRIQQAELEYQLGREELNLLTLLEESRALQLCLDESNKNSSESHTLYSCVNGKDPVIVLGIETVYDPKNPKFGASQKDSVPGLWIDWALEETGMHKGDRLVEVNGKIVLTKTRDDLIRLLSAAPDPAQIVLLRKLTENGNKFISLGGNNTNKDVASLRTELETVRERADEAQKTKENLITDNIRLTHRISYLEEQVSELLQSRNKVDSKLSSSKSPVISTVKKTNQNVTNINITTTTQPTVANLQNNKELQVFQKGPQVTALVANLPGLETNKEIHTSLPIRSRSSMSNVSNTTISASELQQTNDNCHKNHRHKSRSINKIDQSSDKITYRKHNHHHHHHQQQQQHYNHEKDYSSETNSNIDISRYNKKNIEHRYSYGDKTNSEKDYTPDIMDQSYKKATKIVHELTKNREQNLYEKHRHKCITASEKYNTDLLKHYNARKSTSVLDFRSEVRIGGGGGGGKQSDSKSADELDNIETNHEPHIYRKIQDCRSVKSLDFDSDCNSTTTTTNLTNGYKANNNRNNNNNKHVDYASEPIENNRRLTHYLNYHNHNDNSNIKPRPTPPKKPLRLSLHKTQSLQSVETSTTSSKSSPNKNHESRKRNYRGETSLLCLNKIDQINELNGEHGNKWTNFCTKQIIENGNGENSSSWC